MDDGRSTEYEVYAIRSLSTCMKLKQMLNRRVYTSAKPPHSSRTFQSRKTGSPRGSTGIPPLTTYLRDARSPAWIPSLAAEYIRRCSKSCMNGKRTRFASPTSTHRTCHTRNGIGPTVHPRKAQPFRRNSTPRSTNAFSPVHFPETPPSNCTRAAGCLPTFQSVARLWYDKICMLQAKNLCRFGAMQRGGAYGACIGY